MGGVGAVLLEDQFAEGAEDAVVELWDYMVVDSTAIGHCDLTKLTEMSLLALNAALFQGSPACATVQFVAA